jgi:hypothetical protein
MSVKEVDMGVASATKVTYVVVLAAEDTHHDEARDDEDEEQLNRPTISAEEVDMVAASAT